MIADRETRLILSADDGELKFAETLARHTTLRIGGPAEIFALVKSETGLSRILQMAQERGKKFTILGKGSNVLVADEGIDGFVAMLGGEFLNVEIEGELVIAGGGASLGGVCAQASRAGLSGIEAISGIPSSIGGAVRINAGAYGGEIFDVLESMRLVDRSGGARTARASEIEHGYRWTSLVDSGEIVCSANLRLRRAPRAEIEGRTKGVAERRRGALPGEPNAGSIFKNPPGRFAGKLLEDCGLKGTRIGGAEISTRHANVIVNDNGATSSDVLELMRLMSRKVSERFGVELQPEVELLGIDWP